MPPTSSTKIDGILLLDKPSGSSSNVVLQKAKRLYNAAKAGHTGSLDPLATGMLPICFGEATKFSQYLLSEDKYYQATGLLGIKTDTGDALGKIIEKRNSTVSETQLREALLQYQGEIAQIPSMYSALKHQGIPLYKYARRGINIARNPRAITIHKLELNAMEGSSFSITVHCSKGTYIRSLVEDIGEYLGVGAHLTQLHRVFTASFENEKMYSMEELAEKPFSELLARLLPLDRALRQFPSLILNETEIERLGHGKVLQYTASNISFETIASAYFRLYNDKGNFIGLGELLGKVLKVKRLLAS